MHRQILFNILLLVHPTDAGKYGILSALCLLSMSRSETRWCSSRDKLYDTKSLTTAKTSTVKLFWKYYCLMLQKTDLTFMRREAITPFQMWQFHQFKKMTFFLKEKLTEWYWCQFLQYSKERKRLQLLQSISSLKQTLNFTALAISSPEKIRS